MWVIFTDQKAIFHIDELNEIRTPDGIKELKQSGAYRMLAERYRRTVNQASRSLIRQGFNVTGYPSEPQQLKEDSKESPSDD